MSAWPLSSYYTKEINNIVFKFLGYNNNKLFNKYVLYKIVDEHCSTIVINNNNHNNNKKERESGGDSSYVRL